MILSRDLLFGKIIDIHTHSAGIALGQLLAGKYPYVQDICDLSDNIKRSGIHFAVSFPMVYPVYYNIRELKYNKKYIESGNCDYPYQLENVALYSMIEEMKIKNIIPFPAVSTNAKIDEQLQLLSELDSQYVVNGIKYHPKIERKNVLSDEFKPFVEFALKRDIPVMIHTDMSDEAHPMNVIQLAKIYPNLRICAAHCAHFDEEFWSVVQEYGNVYVDTSPFLRICSDMNNNSMNTTKKIISDYSNPLVVLENLFKRIPNQLMWGTDTPYNRFVCSDNVICYGDDAALLRKSGLAIHFSNNAINFLLGKKD